MRKWLVVLVALGACGGSSEGPAAVPTVTVTSEATPTPSIRPAPEGGVCDGFEPVARKVRAATEIVHDFDTGNRKWRRALNDLPPLFQLTTTFGKAVVFDLEDEGPVTGGDACLKLIAVSVNAINVALARDDHSVTAEFYQALLTYYPDSPHALAAENFLVSHGLPVPD